MSESEHWFAGGTFKSAPSIFIYTNIYYILYNNIYSNIHISRIEI
jgi:hypothetical protein